MKILLLITLILNINISFAASLKVMTFNTMCDICKGSSYFSFPDRVKSFQKILSLNTPDIISLQEVRTVSQLKDILAPFKNYQYIATEHLLVSYADPAIIFDKNKYELIKHDNFWLGPKKGAFSLGWKAALPRQVQWAQFRVVETKQDFIFISTHLDNRIENLLGSAKMISDFIKKQKIPVLMAADTNLTVDMPEYAQLLASGLTNTFQMKWAFSVLGNYKEDKELCYSRKGSKFPECRVDHILVEPKNKWKVKHFLIDTYRDKKGVFPSDHRPIIVNLELI